jgi:hypothetical protein
MDSSKYKAFFVHLPDKIVVFKQMENNLYGMDPMNPNTSISKEKYDKNVFILEEWVELLRMKS